MLAAFWGGGTGSEVLSTEEMRSEHPQTSHRQQGGKAGFSFSRAVGPGWGRKDGAPSAPSGREGGVSVLDRGSQGPRTSPHSGSGGNRTTEPGCEGSTRLTWCRSAALASRLHPAVPSHTARHAPPLTQIRTRLGQVLRVLTLTVHAFSLKST